MCNLQNLSYGFGSPVTQIKIRVFSWLLLMDRLNIRNILQRKKHKLAGNNYNYVLCTNGREETTFHLFFICPFSLDCWRYLNIY
jgi:hypothetical protein